MEIGILSFKVVLSINIVLWKCTDLLRQVSVYCFELKKLETKENVEWEKLQEPNYMDTLTSDVAGATILDQKNYLSELEHIISKERSLRYISEV